MPSSSVIASSSTSVTADPSPSHTDAHDSATLPVDQPEAELEAVDPRRDIRPEERLGIWVTAALRAIHGGSGRLGTSHLGNKFDSSNVVAGDDSAMWVFAAPVVTGCPSLGMTGVLVVIHGGSRLNSRNAFAGGSAAEAEASVALGCLTLRVTGVCTTGGG
jgi:hypothetical protein